MYKFATFDEAMAYIALLKKEDVIRHGVIKITVTYDTSTNDYVVYVVGKYNGGE